MDDKERQKKLDSLYKELENLPIDDIEGLKRINRDISILRQNGRGNKKEMFMDSVSLPFGTLR